MAFDGTDVECTTALRMLAIDTVQSGNSGHPGLPLGAADIVYTIFSRFMNTNPADPTWANRDRFVLSCGHGSALLYSLLHLMGIKEFTIDQLKHFRQWGSLTPGHPEVDQRIGIEVSTGPLGQGFSTSVGLALAERILNARFSTAEFPVMDHYTYVLASDGDLMEGVSHEAAGLAGCLGLGRLIVCHDENGISIDGQLKLSSCEDVAARFAAYGWHVQKVDGHNMAEIEQAIKNARAETTRPSYISCRTHIGFKSPLQDTCKVHGAPLGADGVAKTKIAYGWPAEASFHVPDVVRQRFATFAKRGADADAAWHALMDKYAAAKPEQAAVFRDILAGKLPDFTLPSFPAGTSMATRVASGKVLDAVAPLLPSLVGGSADLTPSTNTFVANHSVDIAGGKYTGNYIRFGIREHGMGQAMNGLSLHYIRPYGATFTIFSDYMRPSVRAAAMQKLPTIFVWTHDSIGLGEDGPTHQPIEQIASLRMIPGLVVLRPSDANEVAGAWRVALHRTDGPSALILSRQNLPVLSPAGVDVSKGAYVLVDVPAPKAVLMATGSEVEVVAAAQKMLAAEGIPARVVSVPSWELFDAQPAEYRASVLPAGVPRFSCEAGVTAPWAHYVGDDKSHSIGMDTYGASAPYQMLYKQFGITGEAMAARVKQVLSASH
eukprot:TRINITY_DN1278_c0_g2_i2.p1 TRINITY_DN1278_c0_g2~~TRINITY_DN1278_c0_g2_i2.p1  ORF type:complete len:661 (-),score=171.00 TRINITY_DN1278_c0_g2_i2:701-2683(-)